MDTEPLPAAPGSPRLAWRSAALVLALIAVVAAAAYASQRPGRAATGRSSLGVSFAAGSVAAVAR